MGNSNDNNELDELQEEYLKKYPHLDKDAIYNGFMRDLKMIPQEFIIKRFSIKRSTWFGKRIARKRAKKIIAAYLTTHPDRYADYLITTYGKYDNPSQKYGVKVYWWFKKTVQE